MLINKEPKQIPYKKKKKKEEPMQIPQEQLETNHNKKSLHIYDFKPHYAKIKRTEEGQHKAYFKKLHIVLNE